MQDKLIGAHAGVSVQLNTSWETIPFSLSLYAGDLRACTYCRKIALNYAHSADSGSIGEDLSVLSDSPCSVCVLEPSEPRTPVGGRKASRNIFLEEDLTWQRWTHTQTQLGQIKSEIFHTRFLAWFYSYLIRPPSMIAPRLHLHASCLLSTHNYNHNQNFSFPCVCCCADLFVV